MLVVVSIGMVSIALPLESVAVVLEYFAACPGATEQFVVVLVT
jgi:hypothetical protein